MPSMMRHNSMSTAASLYDDYSKENNFIDFKRENSATNTDDNDENNFGG